MQRAAGVTRRTAAETRGPNTRQRKTLLKGRGFMSRIIHFSIPILLAGMTIFGCGSHAAQAQNLAQPASGQQSDGVSDQDIQLLRKNLRSQRKQLIAANMKLTDAEAEKFWPLYDQYVSDLVKTSQTYL
jgi:hypothetical protein